MNGQQVKVSVEGGQDISNLCLLKVNSCWRKHEITVFDSIGQEIRFKAKTNCSHFSNCQGSILHVLPPSIHYLLKFRKIIGDDVMRVIYLPHVSPLRIPIRLKWGQGKMRVPQGSLLTLIILEFFLVFMHDSHSIVGLRGKIKGSLSLLKLSASFGEIVFHQVKKLIIVVLINPWILDDHQSIFFKRFCNLLASHLPSQVPLKEVGDVNGGNIECGAAKLGNS